MAVKGPFGVEFAEVFPEGASVKRIEPALDFGRSTAENEVQAYDAVSGEPVWSVTVVDDDPMSDAVLRVKVASPTLPQIPDGSGRYRAVVFDGLRVQPWVRERGRPCRTCGHGVGVIAYSLRAGTMRFVEDDAGESSVGKEAA